VTTVLAEDASRFARQLIIQEAGFIALIERGVRVLTASGDDQCRHEADRHIREHLCIGFGRNLLSLVACQRSPWY
jgi:hypothetical protein